MVEALHLIKPDGRTFTTAEIIPGSLVPFAIGAENPGKVLLRIQKNGHSQDVPMVLKTPQCFDTKSFDCNPRADRYISIWTGLKQAGIPVVPTVRKISDDAVVMTDLTHDGSIVYGGHQANFPDRLPNDIGNHKIHQAFLSIQLEDVRNASKRILDRAIEHEIALPNDDPLEIVVRPDGTWHLIALDIGNTMFYCGSSRATFLNELNLAIISDNFQEIQTNLRKRTS